MSNCWACLGVARWPKMDVVVLSRPGAPVNVTVPWITMSMHYFIASRHEINAFAFMSCAAAPR